MTSVPTVLNAIEGFKKSGVFSWNPSIIDDKKLAQSTILEKNTELPDVNSSINECVPARGDKGNEDDVQKGTKTVAEVHSEPPKAKEPKGMAAMMRPYGLLNKIVIDGICYLMTPLEEPKEACLLTTSPTAPVSSAKCSKILNDVLITPVVKKKKTLWVCMSKMLRCISSKEFQNLMQEKEEAKHKEEEAKEDRKRIRQAKVEEKKWLEEPKHEKWELT